MTTLFEPFTQGALTLQNRTVMAPLTRCRAVENNTPNDLMATYYGQRSSAGLIITEGTSPSPNGLGYARIPGLFNHDQVLGWQKITDSAHQGGAKIFVQLMHTGRVSHQNNLPPGGRVMGPMAETCPGEMWTDGAGMQAHTQPISMTQKDIDETVGEFANAARHAVEAGFDGVELHAANGYLLEQFLNSNVNHRADGYGGSSEARNRFVLEVAQAVISAIGSPRMGIRLSPYGVFNSTGAYEGLEDQCLDLIRQLSGFGIAYLHLLDHSATGAPPVPKTFKVKAREAFKGTLIACGGFDRQTAEHAIQEGLCDLVAFGRPFLANPDLVARMKANAPLNEPDPSTFYMPGPKGYTDYPSLGN